MCGKVSLRTANKRNGYSTSSCGTNNLVNARIVSQILGGPHVPRRCQCQERIDVGELKAKMDTNHVHVRARTAHTSNNPEYVSSGWSDLTTRQRVSSDRRACRRDQQTIHGSMKEHAATSQASSTLVSLSTVTMRESMRPLQIPSAERRMKHQAFIPRAGTTFQRSTHSSTSTCEHRITDRGASNCVA
jgi:hypothetical protein